MQYVVKAGDTLYLIAQRFGTTVDALVQANHLSNPNVINVGQVLIIPGSSAPGPAPKPPQPKPPHSPACPELQKGSRGAAVTRLQNLLQERGFSPGAIDGIFGPKTENAVRQFQSYDHLPVTGVVNVLTWEALGVNCGKTPHPGPKPKPPHPEPKPKPPRPGPKPKPPHPGPKPKPPHPGPKPKPPHPGPKPKPPHPGPKPKPPHPGPKPKPPHPGPKPKPPHPGPKPKPPHPGPKPKPPYPGPKPKPPHPGPGPKPCPKDDCYDHKDEHDHKGDHGHKPDHDYKDDHGYQRPEDKPEDK